jgi:uncharacterized protein (DUF488 family)
VRLWTIGHGARETEELVALLRLHDVRTLCDVRAFPRSRRHPRFDRAALEAALGDAGVAYQWLGRELGGFRAGPATASPHVALDAFRGYADHMEGAPFREGVARLLALARKARTAFLCAERDWRECHRRYLSDHLVALDGATVTHILDADRAEEHALHPHARVADGRLVYDAGAQRRLFP